MTDGKDGGAQSGKDGGGKHGGGKDGDTAFDRRGPAEIEPGHKGGSGASQGRSTTKDASTSDKDPGAGDRQKS